MQTEMIEMAEMGKNYFTYLMNFYETHKSAYNNFKTHYHKRKTYIGRRITKFSSCLSVILLDMKTSIVHHIDVFISRRITESRFGTIHVINCYTGDVSSKHN